MSNERERLSGSDWRSIALWLILAAISIVVVARYFASAFPEASIDFKVDRNASRDVAEKFLRAQGLDVRARKHAATFDSDGQARIFLERSLGLERANGVMRDRVRVWSWRHRWFTPLVEEEISVDVAPSGEIIGFGHKLPEDARAPAKRNAPRRGAPAGRPVTTQPTTATTFLRSVGVNVNDLVLVEQSERRLPRRVQRIYTFESKSVRPAGAPYRVNVTIDDDVVTSYSQRLKVPDAWQRAYRELRSKNAAAGSIDLVLMIATLIAAAVVFIVRLRRGDIRLRFLLGIGIVSVVLVGGVTLNSLPSQLAYYDTTTSYPAFLGKIAFQAAVECLGTAMVLMVICGAGEVLYRQRLPQHLAMPRLWTRKALNSRRVFLSMILGYALVPMFIAYQVVFYIVAQRFGAWSPQEVPYDEMLNTALPWVAVLFAGFFPALSEEFLFRAFSIPFLERILRSRFAAIVLAGFVWGFGHAAYPNQPFWIRGVEVGMAGIVAGLLMMRFGLLPLLIWHYTIDAVYTATLLFASGNTYYVVSASIASLVFAIPLIVAIVLYVRNGGFAPDDDLTNVTLPIAPPPEHPEVAEVAAQFPEPIRATPRRVLLCVVLIAVAAALMAFAPPAAEDAIDYRITKEQAKAVARTAVLAAAGWPSAAGTPPGQPAGTPAVRYEYTIATAVEGFRSWDASSPREEGGSPGGFDGVAANYLLRQGMKPAALANVFLHQIEAGTFMVRFFTPMKKEEVFVEIDPRNSRAVGYHKYQDEQNPGAMLDQAHALPIARAAFAAYGIDANRFDVKEALSFQQPRRRDWLFHFEERAPLYARAHRRVTVRVAGNEVTQFNKTVKVPDSVYREAAQETLFNVILYFAMVAAIVAGLAIVITGVVLATRSHGLPWQRALRWTAVLSIVPVAVFFAQHESMLFAYNTSVAWETFGVSMITMFVRDVGLKIGVLFLALAGLEAAVPYAPSLLRAEGRARFGRSAAVAALTALAIFAIGAGAWRWVEPSVSVNAPTEVAMPLPALFAGAQALFGSIVFAACVALFALTMRKHAALAAAVILFFVTLDPSTTLQRAPLMFAHALGAAILGGLIAHFVLDANPLAWPLTMFLAATLQIAAMLLQNGRPDLIANGVAMLVLAIAALLFLVIPSVERGTSVDGRRVT